MKPSSMMSVALLGVSLVAGVLAFTDVGGPVRFALLFIFLCFCPGLMLTRFLRLREPLVEWTLAVALSFAADVLVAGASVLIGHWAPMVALGILVLGTAAGAVIFEADAFRVWWRAWA